MIINPIKQNSRLANLNILKHFNSSVIKFGNCICLLKAKLMYSFYMWSLIEQCHKEEGSINVRTHIATQTLIKYA